MDRQPGSEPVDYLQIKNQTVEREVFTPAEAGLQTSNGDLRLRLLRTQFQAIVDDGTGRETQRRQGRPSVRRTLGAD